MSPAYLYERAKRDLCNLSMIRHTKCDGYIVTMKHSGTHWLRYLVSLVMSKAYSLPTPENVECQDYTYMPQARSKYPHIPRIVASHQIPSPLFTLPLIRDSFTFPDCLLLVRDPRHSLVACYHKHKHEHNLAFADFLRVRQDLLFKATGKRKFVNDIWWLSRFLNSWSVLLEQHPDKITLLRYEDLRSRTRDNLIVALKGLNLPVPDNEVLDWCIAESSKEKMAQKEDTARSFKVVRQDDSNPLSIFSADDKRFFLETFERNCRSSLGYDLHSGW
ncbi:MAG TPA: sulfotransferase domain-containing protein [Luteolibacter sp.]|nr:sulfotransferase domain-containing protein [Luteolibacter sp.]